jgi:outer membrane lipoprotein-sorting protein
MKTTIIFFLFLISSFTSRALEYSAYEIMEKSDEQSSAKDESMLLTMGLVNSKGKEMVRKIEQITRQDNNKNRSLIIKFLAPADVKGTGFLSLEHKDREDDQWLYLPALNKTRRISASDETDSFMGSDFTFEDLNREDLKDYSYTLKGEVTHDETACYLIEAIPNNEKKKKESGYSKREITVRKDNFVIVHVKFYGKDGQPSKIFKASNVKQVPGSPKYRAYKLEMEDLKNKHKTYLTLENIKIDKGVSADLFTQRYLERAN